MAFNEDIPEQIQKGGNDMTKTPNHLKLYIAELEEIPLVTKSIEREVRTVLNKILKKRLTDKYTLNLNTTFSKDGFYMRVYIYRFLKDSIKGIKLPYSNSIVEEPYSEIEKQLS